jgi:Zn-dependent protease
MTFLVVVIGWILSLCLHEFSHALVAYYGGDWTVREKGYLTFNPLKYTHPVYSILLPLLFLVLGGIGLPGGAVYIEKGRLRSRAWETAVSLAGPLSNLLVALALGLVLRFAPVGAAGIWPGLAFLGLLQVMATLFNLLPVPPFDGYGALSPHLDPGLRYQMDRFGQVSIWLVLLIFWYVPVISNGFWNATFSVAQALGVPLQLASMGYSAFQFWR